MNQEWRSENTKVRTKVDFWLSVVVAVIILQTLRFKFGGLEESVVLFSQVSEFVFGVADYEAYLRVGTGIVELIAGVLLFTKRFVYGALLTVGTMFGAIKTHLFIIGIVFQNDGGVLFATGVLTLLLSAYLVWKYRSALPLLGKSCCC